MASHRLHGIFGTGRHKAASRRKQRRDGPLVGPQHLQRDEFGDVAQRWLSGLGLQLSILLLADFIFSGCLAESFCSTTTKARLTSFTTAVKSLVSNDFFGLMTTSAEIPCTGRVMRTASRKRRFMRLRCTAPPSARPTVNPTRSPCGGGVPARVSADIASVVSGLRQ